MEIKLPTISQVDLAYIAGIVDGEGSIIISSTKKKLNRSGLAFKVVTQVVNTNLEVLEWIKETVGSGNIVLDKAPGASSSTGVVYRKQSYRLLFKPLVSEQLCKLLEPYLRIKKKQAQNLIIFQSLRKGPTNYKEHKAEELYKRYLYNRALNGTKLQEDQLKLIEGMDTKDFTVAMTERHVGIPVAEIPVVREKKDTFSDKKCSLEGCSEKHYGLGFCRLHYRRQFECKTVTNEARECLWCKASVEQNGRAFVSKFCSISCKGKWHRQSKQQNSLLKDTIK